MPKDMPLVAWSNWGEIRAYADVKEVCEKTNNTGQPGAPPMPASTVKALRRAYCAPRRAFAAPAMRTDAAAPQMRRCRRRITSLAR